MGAGSSLPFAAADGDADGKVSASDLVIAVRTQLGEAFTDAEAAYLVGRFDGDGDGKLTQPEFDKALKYVGETRASPAGPELRAAWLEVSKAKDAAAQLLQHVKETAVASSARHAETTLDDVPGIVAQFKGAGGVAPLAVLVEEVSAMQSAKTRLEQTALVAGRQLEYVSARSGHMGTTALDNHRAIKASLERTRELADEQRAALEERAKAQRATGAERYTPLLTETVDEYNRTFERLAAQAGGESDLDQVHALCTEISAQVELRQNLGIAIPVTDARTLLRLLELAIHAAPVLREVAEAAAAGIEGCEVVAGSKPTKGIQRSVAKTQEEYGGDYTKLLDPVRISLIFATIAGLKEALRRLVKGELRRFVPKRTKDRLSRAWDAELAGGMRDVLINGEIDLGGSSIIGEIQLHVRPLFDLKHDLHTLYGGARVLGMGDEAMVRHEGSLDDEVLARAERGVVRQLGCDAATMTPEARDRLVRLVQTEPCHLLGLRLNAAKTTDGKPVFEGQELGKILMAPSGGVACRRLSVLHLSQSGVVGGLPSALFAQLPLLRDLYAYDAPGLTGPIPGTIGRCRLLEVLIISNCKKITGPLPPELGECRRLRKLNLQGLGLNCAVPETYANLTKLTTLFLDRVGLTITDELKAKWEAALPSEAKCYWP